MSLEDLPIISTSGVCRNCGKPSPVGYNIDAEGRITDCIDCPGVHRYSSSFPSHCLYCGVPGTEQGIPRLCPKSPEVQ